MYIWDHQNICYNCSQGINEIAHAECAEREKKEISIALKNMYRRNRKIAKGRTGGRRMIWGN